jgi:hypothetical protein
MKDRETYDDVDALLDKVADVTRAEEALIAALSRVLADPACVGCYREACQSAHDRKRGTLQQTVGMTINLLYVQYASI